MSLNNSFYKSLSELISINSELSAPKENMPFGEGPYKALHCFLALAKNMGFETINYDNYAGEIYFGEGEEIGIIGHLDIVPAGVGWETDPFTLTEKNGALYGRGMEDDKAPLLLCLYALKELKDSGIKFNSKIRLFVGCNEETGWKDVEYLKSKTTLPEYGFSPDGDFPLSYAEKGIFYVDFTLNKLKNFNIIKSGSAINAVCGYAEAIVKESLFNKISKTEFNLLCEKHNVVYQDNIVKSYGKSAHGSAPQKGINAIKILFELFNDCGEDLSFVIDCLFNDKFKVFELESPQGNVTFSPNLIEERENDILIKCDCRLPYPLTENHLREKFDKFNLSYTLTEKHPTFCTSKDSKLVKSLINAYNVVMGENAKPVAIGGSTFSRAFDKGCAFGPYMGGFGGAHVANEYATIEVLEKTYKIYLQAIKNLIQ